MALPAWVRIANAMPHPEIQQDKTPDPSLPVPTVRPSEGTEGSSGCQVGMGRERPGRARDTELRRIWSQNSIPESQGGGQLRLQARGPCSIVPSDFIYKTEVQR